ncbi:hypothetical protein EYR40_004586 [Pleurotus pulmonarius]|nr:hypothetical protein EYR38_001816 [Pleurotus pulmonarius]KAF4605796.1 hypothetical protein EYR40_004586 [Pleurotus pulmonarius]
MDRVVRLVSMSMARIQDLELSLETYHHPRIEELLMAETAPLLQSLRLNSDDESFYGTECGGIHGFLNEVQMPRLHTMVVILFALPPTIPMLPQLRRLTYVPPMEGGVLGATMSSMLSFLRSAPSLERLEISGTFRSPDEGLEERTMTELPNLSFVFFVTMDFENAALFRLFKYPPSSRVEFISHIPPANTALCTSHLEPILACTMESSDFVATVEAVTFVAVKGSYFSMLAAGPVGPVLEISFLRKDGDLATLFRLCAALPSSNAHTLRICGFSSITAADWAGLFGRYEQVRELTVDEVDGNFLCALFRSSRTGRPPFMRLKRLTLMHCDTKLGPTIVEQIIKEHRILDSPVDVLEIVDCRVMGDIISRLREYVEVEWDANMPDEVIEDED